MNIAELFLRFFQNNRAVLLRSHVEYHDQIAYVSLVYKDGQRTLKATEIKGFSFNQNDDCYLLCISENQCNETKNISKKCKDEIEKLQFLLDEIIYE